MRCTQSGIFFIEFRMRSRRASGALCLDNFWCNKARKDASSGELISRGWDRGSGSLKRGRSNKSCWMVFSPLPTVSAGLLGDLRGFFMLQKSYAAAQPQQGALPLRSIRWRTGSRHGRPACQAGIGLLRASNFDMEKLCSISDGVGAGSCRKNRRKADKTTWLVFSATTLRVCIGRLKLDVRLVKKSV